jgi:thiamine kinase-like enzyme
MITKSQAEKICRLLKKDYVGYKYLAAGSHNQIYLLKTKNRDFVLKVGNNKTQLEREYNILKKLKKSIGPEVYLFDKSSGIIVMELIEGKHPSKKASSEFIKKMAQWYRKLHSIKSAKIEPEERRLFNSLVFWHTRTKNNSNEITNLFSQTEPLFKKHEKLFADRKSFVLNQNDPSNDNIFIKGDKLKVIDWEFAGFGLFERDILTFFSQYHLSDKQKELFLNQYGYPKTKIARDKLNILSIILLLANVVYLANRIEKIKNGEISKKQQSSNASELTVQLDGLTKKIKKLISHL